MAHFATHAQIKQAVGVDGVEQSLQAFADENPSLDMQKKGAPNEQDNVVTQIFEGEKISLLLADYFELTESHTGGRFEAIFDRGSLVAIDPKLRAPYVDTIGKLVSSGGKILLVTYERLLAEDLKNGPPFSFNEKEVRELYEPLDWVESVTLLKDDAEKKFIESRPMNIRAQFFLVAAK